MTKLVAGGSGQGPDRAGRRSPAPDGIPARPSPDTAGSLVARRLVGEGADAVAAPAAPDAAPAATDSTTTGGDDI